MVRPLAVTASRTAFTTTIHALDWAISECIGEWAGDQKLHLCNSTIDVCTAVSRTARAVRGGKQRTKSFVRKSCTLEDAAERSRRFWLGSDVVASLAVVQQKSSSVLNGSKQPEYHTEAGAWCSVHAVCALLLHPY